MMSTSANNKYYPPLGYSQVETGIYRSAYPAEKSIPWIETLQIKTFLCLSPSEMKPSLREYAQLHQIQLIECEIKFNREPFLSMDEQAVNQALRVLQDKSLYPILVFCTNGKVRTSCLIACYRKLQGWSMTSIIEEFEFFSDPEGNICDLRFVERFQHQIPIYSCPSSDTTDLEIL